MSAQKNNKLIEWTPKMKMNFQLLKNKFKSGPIPAAPDFDSGEKLILTTVWSAEAVGWVLSQVQRGAERMIACGGRKCNPAESNYVS